MFVARIVVLTAALALSCAGAADIVAETCSETLVLKGDQTGSTIKIARDYLPAKWKVATSIYAKGKPKFVLPDDYRVKADGDGWWTVFRRDVVRSYAWTGGGGDAKWETCANWKPHGVPGRLDTVKLCKDAKIDLGRDRMVSNIVFTAKVILANGAVHVRNTIGRGAEAKLGVRAGSCLGKIKAMDGAVVQPLRGMAGYKGVLETDADGVARVALTRPSASYTWTGSAGDGRWTSLRNWTVGGRIPMEPPCECDQVVFDAAAGAKRGFISVVLPPGQTVVSNLVAKTHVRWKGTKDEDVLSKGASSSLDICDLSGNRSFSADGDGVTISLRTSANIPVVALKGSVLALSRHGHRPYKSITVMPGAQLMPYDWPVEVEKLVLKNGSTILFWPPRHFNKWRPLWVVHARHLEGDVRMETDDMSHWRQNIENWSDGSFMITINWRD